MKNELRWIEIVKQVDEHGYLSVQELSELCDTSPITIRRDLAYLCAQNRVKRTHGGAASLHAQPRMAAAEPFTQSARHPAPRTILDRVDVLITSDPLTGLLPARGGQQTIPVVAESMTLPEAATCVEVDNYAAGFALGAWAGRYAAEKWNGRANLLDLTYHRVNTKERSRGFLDGLRSILPNAELRFSINTQSREEMAYQLTSDALSIYPDINIIFAINDISALGAVRACKELKIPPGQVIILPFGLEGSTMLDQVDENAWCVAGLSMFPEIVAASCVEAAVAAYARKELPDHLITPFCIVTHANLNDYYIKTVQGWKLRWPDLPCDLKMPLPVDFNRPPTRRRLPGRIGFLYTYADHEWYKSLVQEMRDYCARMGIELEVMDLQTTHKDELHLRRQEIARRAVQEVKPGDTIFVDGGPISGTLAGELAKCSDITVITNSLEVINALRDSPSIVLIAAGGALRRTSKLFVGPTAETALKEFHVDKLFLMVSGVSSQVGLTHTNISEVTIKQQMIRSAREVILLADHACFEQESLVQVAPLSVVHKLITDDVLPVSVRLDLGTKGIQVILAAM